MIREASIEFPSTFHETASCNSCHQEENIKYPTAVELT